MSKPTLLQHAATLLAPRLFDGPLTAELVTRPGGFGLGKVPARLAPEAVVDGVCGFCSTGCSLRLHLRDGQAVNLSPNPDYPVNRGLACPKGWEALAPLEAADRATTPLLRSRRHPDDPPRQLSWTDAARVFRQRMRDIQARHGRESVAFLGTGQIVTEELALLGAFAKFGMGMIHGDGNTRQCMATSVVAYKQAFGFDAPPYTYDDFEQSDLIILIGSNLCIAHPILWQRVLANRRGAEIVVVDPRRTETAEAAHHHVPLLPKSDLVFWYAVARELIARDWIDRRFIRAHVRGFDEFARFVQPFTLERAASECGLPVEAIARMAERIGTTERVSLWWTMGVNQGHESTATANAIINIALMTGQIGRPGTGANSITGQCNAMGSRLFSNTTNLLGGHDFASPADRRKVAGVLGMDESLIQNKPGHAYDQIIDGIHEGRIRGLWVVATNGAHSWIQQQQFHRAMAKLDFLVVQDMYATTETARMADLLLPAAGWAEKDGTFINSERRIGRVRKVRRAPGQALADFSIVRLLADAWGAGSLFQRWTHPEAVFHILRELSRDQPCDFTGVSGYDMLDAHGGIQWPLPADHKPGAPGAVVEAERRLFSDGAFFTADQRARLVWREPQPPPEVPDETWPLWLLTGRGSSAQWHTGSRTGKSPVLNRLHPDRLLVDVHPDDARARRLADGDAVWVASRRARIRAFARVTAAVGRGRVFLPMHDPEVNRLTMAIVDPQSRQPSYKACAVDLQPAGP